MVPLKENHIYEGEATRVLRNFPAQSVQMCVTSPPYWGLRDYGTAEWKGGDPGCDHMVGRFSRECKSDKQKSNYGSGSEQAKHICPTCGAKRIDSQIGMEKTPEEFVENLVTLFGEVNRVLKDDGTLWLNLGDSYNGSGGAGGDYAPGGSREGQPKYGKKFVPTLKPKDLVGIPWRVAFALQEAGWYLRSDIIWSKPNPMPESVKDRPVKSHEYIFLLSKSRQYFYDVEAVKEPLKSSPEQYLRAGKSVREHHVYPEIGGRPIGKSSFAKMPTGRNLRTVWTIPTSGYKGAHFAVFPPSLIRPCIKAGSRKGDIVLDPFIGSGTTALVAYYLDRSYVGIDLNPEYIKIAEERLRYRENLIEWG